MSKINLSQHRHISFTAHYTGYIWYSMGLSHTAFATRKGQALCYLLKPIEACSERLIGGSIRHTLQQRHRLIDRTLVHYLEKYPDTQVIEIATGLSPRGWSFRQRYPSLRFIEVDLPDMAHTKSLALANAGQPDATVLAVDLFTPQLSQIFAGLDRHKPLIVISEGLVNYFSKDLLQQLWCALAEHGKSFTTFHYLTDICPEPNQHPFAKLVWRSSKVLKILSRSAFSFHFTSPQQVKDFFQQCGFDNIVIQQPSQDHQDVPTEHLGDFVWVVDASL